jgi:acyl-CoA thioester hydrolase
MTHDRTVTSAVVSARFTMPITAAAADIDELGHVSNLVYVRWILDVATAHSRALGWDHARYRELGAVFVVRRHEIDYVAQVREGEVLAGETWVDGWRLASCVRRTELRRGAQVVARGATTWAFISLASGRPQRIPDELRALFGAS